ncbi:peptidase domain-containing ABC transporter [Neiella sp. HB171785]|uniref:Peptidase domain-containing ABC transporter n=1 Tax=Neiella litorisoli TaxID=2771431 RepID=A0A8J6UJ73_9GAMM|nr:peptidase domain-containing ABC transporter [Neiella litorisoli]MBD1390033.1 peptidase domain-containing ABC transporter [Neiella litorisoli]
MTTTTLNNADKLVKFSGWRTLPLIQQTEVSECGLACVAMIAGYYGREESLSSLRKRSGGAQRGLNLQQLIQLASDLGLSGRALQLDMDHLKKLQTPCVLHWDMNHFVVLKKVTRDAIVIHDPAAGERRLTMTDVSKHFTGIALELAPTSDFQKCSVKERLKLSQLWSNIVGFKSSLLRLVVLSVVLQALALASPYYSQLVVDDVLLSHDKDLLLVLALGFGLVMLSSMATNLLRGVVVLHFSAMLNIQIAANLFRHLVRLPINYFQNRHIGDVISRFGSLQQVKELLTTGVVEALIDGVMALTVLVMLFVYSVKLAFVVVIAVALFTMIRLVLFKPLRQKNEEAISHQAKESSHFIETVRAIQTVKLFGAENQRQSLWQNRLADTLNANIRIGQLDLGFISANKLLFGLEHVIVIYLAALLVMDGQFSVGMLFAFIAYKQQFTERVANLIEKLIQFKMLGLHLERLADIALTPKEAVNQSGLKPELNGRIEFKSVGFRYQDGAPYLFNNATFDVAAGESVALIGPSGAGKSTLIKTLLGLLPINKGEILVDGHELPHLCMTHYRQQVASVMQDDQLLSGSIADNITFFSDELDMERIANCAKMAAVHDDIMAMPMNYNSLIGDMGSSLSGGQKQRILLARALYQQPKILLLDEATSHLDLNAERLVNHAIAELNITRVIIAHRPETMISADRILHLTRDGVEDVTQQIKQQLGAVA